MADDEISLISFFIFGIILLLAISFIMVIVGGFYIIDAGERGVLLTWGEADPIPKTEGFYFKWPIMQKIIKIDIKTQKYEADLSAASKDLQDVNTRIAINYHLIAETTPQLYTEIGLDFAEKIIYPYEQETNKGITSLFTAEELITKREQVREKMKIDLAEKLRPRGIIIEEVSIVDFKFSKSFTEAIESKVTAEQLKLKADRDLERIKVEAEQKISQAQAEATSLKLQKQEVTPELVKLREIEVQRLAVEKWNGILPTYTGGAMPFIQIQ